MAGVKVSNLGIRFSLDKKSDATLKNTILNFLKRERKKQFWALRNINFELKNGDILGITGPNGSGKSTLLRAITGIYYADEGKIDVRGKVSLLAIGAGFEKELTGIENIYLNGAIFGFSKSKINRILKRIIDFADIGQFIYQPIRTYSSGMASRLGFAIAINLDPDILLIDEVMAVGDADFKKKCLKSMDRFFRNEDKIAVFVSHDMELIKKICNKAIVLEKGSMKALDI